MQHEILRHAFAAARDRKKAEQDAAEQFRAHAPLLHRVLEAHSGHSHRVAIVLRSLWSGELCDALAGNDLTVAEAICAAVRLRAMCEGNADEELRPLADKALEILSTTTEPQP